MSEREFKVGDRVRIKDGSWSTGEVALPGDVAVITSLYEPDGAVLGANFEDEGRRRSYYTKHEMEPVSPAPNPCPYLAGPMRGIAEYNFPAFLAAEAQLKEQGIEVFNPAQHDIDNGFDYKGLTGHEDLSGLGFDLRKALGADVNFIAHESTGVIVLPGWEKSSGARAEVALAQALSLPVVTLEGALEKGLDAPQVDETRPAGFGVATPALQTFKPGDVVRVVTGAPRAGATLLVTSVDEDGRVWAASEDGTPDWFVNLPHSLELVTRAPVGFVLTGHASTDAALRQQHEVIQRTIADIASVTDVQHVYAFDGSRSSDVVLTGEVRSVSSTGAEKGVKPERLDLLPTQALSKVARHYGVGAAKYADHNWRKGYEWSKSYAALQRHANAFWGGEDIDEETGSPHMAAVAFHALALLTFMDEQPGFDDRYRKDAA